MLTSEAIVKALESEGVKDIFGLPGAAINPFLAALAKSDINFTLVRAESAAGFAANGYARISGQAGVRSTNTDDVHNTNAVSVLSTNAVGVLSTNPIGVCAVTSGAGALGLLPAIACAYADSIPIIAITGQVKTAEVGSDAFQEADITGAAEPFVKYSYLVKNPNDIPSIIKEAFYLAKAGRQGPVLIDIPVDVQEAVCEYIMPGDIDLRSYKPTIDGNSFQIRKAVELIAGAKRPLIIAGGGVISSGAKEQLSIFARRHSIPVCTTMMGLGIMTGESLNLGMIGMFGDSDANEALNAADTLIIVGARVGERSIPDPSITKGKDIIHADIDPAELGKNIIPTIPIVSDCKSFLQKADELFSEPISSEPWTKRSNISTTADKLTEYLKVLAGYARPGTVIAADVGNNQIAASKIRIKDGVFITSGGMGTMGYGLPAAIGALTADKNRDVICISGDGGFQMSMAELATVKAYSLPVKIIIINDSSLGMVRDAAQKIGFGDIAEGFSTDLAPGNPDFAALAKSYGITSETVRDYNTDSIKRLLESKSAYLIDLVI